MGRPGGGARKNVKKKKMKDSKLALRLCKEGRGTGGEGSAPLPPAGNGEGSGGGGWWPGAGTWRQGGGGGQGLRWQGWREEPGRQGWGCGQGPGRWGRGGGPAGWGRPGRDLGGRGGGGGQGPGSRWPVGVGVGVAGSWVGPGLRCRRRPGTGRVPAQGRGPSPAPLSPSPPPSCFSARLSESLIDGPTCAPQPTVSPAPGAARASSDVASVFCPPREPRAFHVSNARQLAAPPLPPQEGLLAPHHGPAGAALSSLQL